MHLVDGYEQTDRLAGESTDTRTHLIFIQYYDPMLLCDESLDNGTHHALCVSKLFFALNVISLLLITTDNN